MAEQIFGPVTNPLASGYGSYDEPGKGVVGLLSNIIKTITIAGGLFAFFNLLIAGFGFISSGGNPEKTSKAWAKIYNSLLGIVIMVASFTIAVILGWLLFKNPTAILQPEIYGPGIN